MAKLQKSKTNFTLKRLHQSGNYGNIYERDYTTIVPSIGVPSGQIPIYSAPSFKLSVRSGANKQKKYNHGKWELNGDGYNWTLNNMPEPNKKSSKIILKPHSKKLSDFACYGSASELIRASMTNIISNFPAELYVTNQTIEDSGFLDIVDSNSPLYIKCGSAPKEYVFISNPFRIDLLQDIIPEGSNVSPLRYIRVNYGNYEVIDDSNNKRDITGWNISTSTNNNTCLYDGDLIATINVDADGFDDIADIYCFFVDEEIYFVCKRDLFNHRIRPKNEYIDDFFNKLNDFEKIILNRETQYTAIFDTYYEDEEDGWYVTEKSYTWITGDGDWNLEIENIGYGEYVNALTLLAETYDELYSDAIWRDMVHESISNMDLTSMYNDVNSEINTTKMRQTLNVIGRQFDEIKKYIDNIKSSNSITYDQNQNMPDYFLSDNLELSGWEVKDILNGVPENIKTEPMYGSRKIGFTSSDANSEFMRRLSLNYKGLLSKKGTKQAIEELMAIFGFHSTDWIDSYYGKNGFLNEYARKAYKIDEYVTHVSGYSGFPKVSQNEYANILKQLNVTKDTYNGDFYNDPDAIIDDYQGIAVAELILNTPLEGESFTEVNELPQFENTAVTYLKMDNIYYVWDSDNNKYTEYNRSCIIPWFDKNKEYDNDVYFQDKGGWGKKTHYERYEKYNKNNNNNIGPTEQNTTNISGTTLPSFKVSEYISFTNTEDSSQDGIYKWTRFVENNNNFERTVSKINFVHKKDDLLTLLYGNLKNGDIYYAAQENCYYTLTNAEYFNNFESGWTSSTTVNEESIIDNNKGNNPHSGDYDDGRNFFHFIETPLKKTGLYGRYVALDNRPASATTINTKEVTEIPSEKVNDKTYLYDTKNGFYYVWVTPEDIGFGLRADTIDGQKIKHYFYNGEVDTNTVLRKRFYDTNENPVDLIQTKDNIENLSFSILNNKRLNITFDCAHMDFIEKDVLPYLKQIIPSTTIFTYCFEHIDGSDRTLAIEKGSVCNENICSVFSVTE